MNQFIAWVRRFLGIDRPAEPPTPPPDPCDSPACVNARREMDGARAGFNRVCDGLRSAVYVYQLLSQMLVASPWILVALVAVAVIVGGLLAVAIFALLGAYVLAWILNLIVARIIAALGNALGQRANAFAGAVTKVIANCPENCRGDMSPPTCSY